MMDSEDIDFSDIPELTDEYLAHCLVRFRNKPVGSGGEWHKSAITGEISDEQLEQLKARALSEWRTKQDQPDVAAIFQQLAQG